MAAAGGCRTLFIEEPSSLPLAFPTLSPCHDCIAHNEIALYSSKGKRHQCDNIDHPQVSIRSSRCVQKGRRSSIAQKRQSLQKCWQGMKTQRDPAFGGKLRENRVFKAKMC